MSTNNYGRTVASAGILLAFAMLAGCVPAPVSRSANPQNTYAPPFVPATNAATPTNPAPAGIRRATAKRRP